MNFGLEGERWIQQVWYGNCTLTEHLTLGEVGASIVLTNPEREKLRYAPQYGFHTLNNKAEYEALIVRVDLLQKL